VDEKYEALKKSVNEASVIIDIFDRREGFRNAMVLLCLAQYGPVSSNNLAKKLELEQSVAFRRLKNLKDESYVNSFEVAENGKRRNLYTLTLKGLDSCAFLTEDDRLLETAKVFDFSNGKLVTNEPKSPQDPVPTRFGLQMELLLSETAEIYSKTKWGREWLKVKKKLEKQYEKEELRGWISRHLGLELVHE
jgi:DNA-binding MarR family transcriptional regulator